MKCSSCGHEFEGNFCPNCGCPVNSQIVSAVSQNELNKLKRLQSLYMFCAISTFLICVITLFLLLLFFTVSLGAGMFLLIPWALLFWSGIAWLNASRKKAIAAAGPNDDPTLKKPKRGRGCLTVFCTALAIFLLGAALNNSYTTQHIVSTAPEALPSATPLLETPSPTPLTEDPIFESETIDSEPIESSLPSFTESQTSSSLNDQAYRKALDYISIIPFSAQGLVEQLEYEGFTESESQSAVDALNVDWDEQALLKAQSYLNTSSFSYTGLIDQLEYEGFTNKQATYGADHCGADWMEQAALSAQKYLRYSDFSRSKLIDQLEYEGFTYEQAEYGVSEAGL